MPSSLPEFYHLVRARWPVLWANAPQHSEPRSAATAMLQFFASSTSFNPPYQATAEELVAYFENLKAQD